jgi:eukaryotic-like serine/threonine-protein kinase
MSADDSSHPTLGILRAYHGGELDDSAALSVREHVATCADCQRQLAEPSPDTRQGQPGDGPTFDPPTPGFSPTVSDDSNGAGTGELSGSNLEFGSRVRYFGDFELERVLGEGGMGIVYKARQLSLNRPVALKMIKAARFASGDDLRRFQNEAEAVARLDHPNIVPIFEVGRFENQQYFSMKFVAGESLDKRLRDYVAHPRRAAQLLALTARAIHHAHQRGILHRDLKPANVLIDPEGHPHVTDFGLAKRVEGDSELTQSGAILGTPAYMAPEQASGKRGTVTTSTDIYGLGAILYALLAGRPPFGGTAILEILDQVRDREPDSPRKFNSRVPRDLDVICLKCLEKDSRRRYASADALAEDLKRWLAGEPIAARPVAGASRLWMWCRRNPLVAAATGLVAVSLVVVAALSLLYAKAQGRRVNEQAEATRTITTLATNLEYERQDLKTSLVTSNRRLAMLYFERAQRAFDGEQANIGLLWLVESWRAASNADDSSWQRLARANLSFRRSRWVEIKDVFAHNATVWRVAASPNGRRILTGSSDNTARLWDSDTAQPVGKPLVHQGVVWSAKFSPDGKTILTGSWDNTARLWDVATTRPIGLPLRHQDWVRSVAFSPDGKTILTGSADNTARLWDAATARPVGKPMVHQGPVWHVAYGPESKTVLTGSADKTARIWDAATGQPIGEPMAHEAVVTEAAYSPEGRTVLTASADGKVRLWDAATGRPIGQPIIHQGRVDSVMFSPDGKTVLTGSADKTARTWDAATGQPVGRPMVHQAAVSSVAYSPDGKTILTAAQKTAQLWDTATGQPIGQPLIHQGQITSAVYSPDSETILTASKDGKGRRWHLPPELRHGLSQVKAEIEISTRIEVDYEGNLHPLDSAALRERYEQLGRPYPSGPPAPPSPKSSLSGLGRYPDLMPFGAAKAEYEQMHPHR